MTERIFNSQMKFILVLDLKENFKLSEDQMRDIVLIVFKNKVSQMRRIYVKFMLENELNEIIRSSFFMKQEIRMEK